MDQNKIETPFLFERYLIGFNKVYPFHHTDFKGVHYPKEKMRCCDTAMYIPIEGNMLEAKFQRPMNRWACRTSLYQYIQGGALSKREDALSRHRNVHSYRRGYARGKIPTAYEPLGLQDIFVSVNLSSRATTKYDLQCVKVRALLPNYGVHL
jgi:hypothetical protein